MKVLGPLEEGTPPHIVRYAPVSVMAGSLVTLIPIVASVPFLPPFGLLMLLAWRLLRPDALPVWAAAPLGLFDDLVSGQPMGSATLTWQLSALAIDFIDTRVLARDFWQDWLIAAGPIAFALIVARLAATPLRSHVDTLILIQIVVSVALFPLASRLCRMIEAREDE